MSTSKPPHFIVQRNDLVRELMLAVGAVERNTTIPVLANVKIEASDFGRLALTATDPELGMVFRCDAQVKVPGETTLPAKRLLDYARLLPDGPVEIKVGDTHWATITAGRSKARLAGMGSESFPELPAGPEPVCKLPLAVFVGMVHRTIYAICMEESRFTLNGAIFETGLDGLKMVATDGHRLTVAEAPGEAKKAEKYLIPKKALVELVRLAGTAGVDAAVEFAVDENHMFFAVGERLLVARRMAGSFPDYARVIPKSFKGTATVSRQSLKDALNRVRNFADDRSRAVKITIGDGQIGVFASEVESGESEESATAETNVSVVIGFNADYLLDFLGSTETEKVTLSFGDGNSALQMAPVGEPGGHLCVIMPLRL